MSSPSNSSEVKVPREFIEISIRRMLNGLYTVTERLEDNKPIPGYMAVKSVIDDVLEFRNKLRAMGG